MMPNNRQEVTGLVVNERANIRRSDISRLRMILHSIKIAGIEEASKTWVNGDANKLVNHVTGWLAWPQNPENEKSFIDEVVDAIVEKKAEDDRKAISAT